MHPLRLILIAIVHIALFFMECSSGKYKQDVEAPLLLISIDGFMPIYFDRVDTPNLDRLMNGGVVAESLIPVFPTKTFPNHYSIVTGLYPENTGIVSNHMYDSVMDATFNLRDRDAVTDGRWYGGEPIWVTAENQGVRTGTMFWVGSEAEIKKVRPSFWKDFDNTLSNEGRIDSVLNWLTKVNDRHAQFTTLYFGSIDGAGHRHGPNSTEVSNAVKKVDEAVGYLIKKLKEEGIWPNINIMIVSDHGMAELSEDKVIILDDIINLNDVHVIDWTPISMIQPNGGKTEDVYNKLKTAEDGYVVYKKENIPDIYRIKGHHRIPEIMIVADVGYTVTSRSNLERRGILAGTHGFDHRAPEMQGIFIAHGPDFMKGESIPSFQSVHIYEAMCYLLGLEPAPNDGALETLSPILR